MAPPDPFGELSHEKQELFDSLPGSEYFDNDFDKSYAEGLYAVGFGHSAEEYDAMGLTENEVYAAREEFFAFMEMNEDAFPWDEWREVMGYE